MPRIRNTLTNEIVAVVESATDYRLGKNEYMEFELPLDLAYMDEQPEYL